MIHLRNVRLRRGPEPLLEAATVSILRGEKVGLVGRNGCGKSSLLALLRGELALDGGEVVVRGRGYGHGIGLSQEGAWRMAQLGYGFRAILEHYYPGARLSDLQNSGL